MLFFIDIKLCKKKETLISEHYVLQWITVYLQIYNIC